MNRHLMFLPIVLAALLSGCASFSSPKGPPPTPTPASEQIQVLNEDQLPAHYTIVGSVMGSSVDMLQNRARKLGADAIINPKSVDPVTGWATTDAIKFDKNSPPPPTGAPPGVFEEPRSHP
jgi:hypothetical protein